MCILKTSYNSLSGIGKEAQSILGKQEIYIYTSLYKRYTSYMYILNVKHDSRVKELAVSCNYQMCECY